MFFVSIMHVCCSEKTVYAIVQRQCMLLQNYKLCNWHLKLKVITGYNVLTCIVCAVQKAAFKLSVQPSAQGTYLICQVKVCCAVNRQCCGLCSITPSISTL